MPRLWKVALAAATLLAGTTPAAEAQLAYGTTGTEIFTFDFGTGVKTTLGPSGTSFLEGLALAPGGTLYATASNGRLYTINTTTGAGTLVGNTGLGNVEGLDFLGNTLLATNFDDPYTLYSLDLATAAPTPLVSGDVPIDLVRSLAVRDATTGYASSSNNLFRVDLTTGAMTDLGPTGAFIAALDFLGDGNLYAFAIDGTALRIDPTTGDATSLGFGTASTVVGMTAAVGTSAVPEPATVTLVAVGMAVVGVGAARRRTS